MKLIRELSIFFIVVVTLSCAHSQDVELTKKAFKAPNGKAFPLHWGQPPLRQTRDLRPLPGGYGKGSGTLARWIQKNLDTDTKKDVELTKQTFKAPNGKVFPLHWGQPPLRQTRDLKPLPGGYGQGSGTLARWIQKNLDTDAKNPPKNNKLRELEKEIEEIKDFISRAKFTPKGLAKYKTKLKEMERQLNEMRELEKNKIPNFKDWVRGGKKIPEGLIFAGGSPWFNESTGKNRTPEEVYKMIFKKDPK